MYENTYILYFRVNEKHTIASFDPYSYSDFMQEIYPGSRGMCMSIKLIKCWVPEHKPQN